MAETDYHGWPLPDGTDMPFVHLDMKALGDEIDKEMPIVVANWTALQALPPLLNLKALLATQNYRMFVHNGTSWIPSTAGLKYRVGENSAMVGNATGVRLKVDSGEIQPIQFTTTAVVTTDASGYWSYTYPTAFPTGIFSASVINGDAAAGRGNIHDVAGSPFTQSLSALYGSVVDAAGTPRATATVRVNITVTGW